MNEKISNTRKIRDFILKSLVWLSAVIICLLLVGMLCFILIKGLPHISLKFLTTKPSLLNGTAGILPNLLNTLYIIIITLLIVLPLGVGSAVYLNEYAKKPSD